MNKSKLHSILENEATRRSEVIQYMQRAGVVSSELIARGWFAHNSHSTKKACEYLKKLEDEKTIESHYRKMESKLYRLSKKTKKELGDTSYSLSFTRRIDHRLYLAEILLNLSYYQIPPKFFRETRQKFIYKEKEFKYSPDIICTWLGDWFTIEAQRSPMESKKWARKWEVHRAFWESGAYKKADWQPEKPVKPIIVAISKQQPETVRTGCGDLFINVVRSVTELKELLDKGVMQ